MKTLVPVVVAIAVVICGVVIHQTMGPSDIFSQTEISSTGSAKNSKKSSAPKTKGPEISKQKDMSSVRMQSLGEAGGDLVGAYALIKANNPICGQVGDMMQITSRGDGPDQVISLAQSKIRFIDMNAGVKIEPPYEGDPEACGFNRKTDADARQIHATETMTCQGQVASNSTTAVELSAGRLVYQFHQQSFNEKVAKSFDVLCEWNRK